MTDLPEFRKHGSDKKFTPLEERDCLHPHYHILQYIDFISEWTGGPLSQLKVLDLGCGRGEMVGALRAQGVRAYGIEVDPRFVASGSILEKNYQDEHPILSVVTESGKSIFPDDYFDRCFGPGARARARLARGDGRDCARASFRRPDLPPLPREVPCGGTSLPHAVCSLAAKNRLWQRAIELFLKAGLGRQFLPSFSTSERSQIIYKYSVEETFYRSISAVTAEFAGSGMKPLFQEGMRAYVTNRLKRKLPSALPLTDLVATFRVVMFCAEKVR